LTQLIYQATGNGVFSRDFGLRDQIRRAAVGILSNFAEGFERGGDKEFSHFLSQAKGSCAEVRAQLYVALDQEYISEKGFEELKSVTVEISRLISGMMSYLAESPLNCRKFKDREQPSKPRTQDSGLKAQDFGLGTTQQ
jgi:four helix bundle protein